MSDYDPDNHCPQCGSTLYEKHTYPYFKMDPQDASAHTVIEKGIGEQWMCRNPECRYKSSTNSLVIWSKLRNP